MIGLLLTRWKVGLGLFGALAFLGLALAANHYRHAYHAEKALRAADRAAYVAAQAEATRMAEASVRATEAKYAAIAQETHLAYQTDLNRARAAADSYVSRMRIKAASGSTGTAPASAENHSAAGSDRPGEAPFMVAVTADDIGICTENTARLDAVRSWALSLTM